MKPRSFMRPPSNPHDVPPSWGCAMSTHLTPQERDLLNLAAWRGRIEYCTLAVQHDNVSERKGWEELLEATQRSLEEALSRLALVVGAAGVEIAETFVLDGMSPSDALEAARLV